MSAGWPAPTPCGGRLDREVSLRVTHVFATRGHGLGKDAAASSNARISSATPSSRATRSAWRKNLGTRAGAFIDFQFRMGRSRLASSFSFECGSMGYRRVALKARRPTDAAAAAAVATDGSLSSNSMATKMWRQIPLEATQERHTVKFSK